MYRKRNKDNQNRSKIRPRTSPTFLGHKIYFSPIRCLCFGGGCGGRSRLSKLDNIEESGDEDLEEIEDCNIAVPIMGFCDNAIL